MNSDARMADIQIMVVAAFFDSGWRNALTPLEITSIPVTAEPMLRALLGPLLSPEVEARLAAGERDGFDLAPSTKTALARVTRKGGGRR